MTVQTASLATLPTFVAIYEHSIYNDPDMVGRGFVGIGTNVQRARVLAEVDLGCEFPRRSGGDIPNLPAEPERREHNGFYAVAATPAVFFRLYARAGQGPSWDAVAVEVRPGVFCTRDEAARVTDETKVVAGDPARLPDWVHHMSGA